MLGFDDARPSAEYAGLPVRYTVGVLLCNERGEILLQLRDDKPGLLYPNMWTLFGGAVEPDEDRDAAMARELSEELELTVPLTFWRQYVCPVRTVAGEVVVKNNIYLAPLSTAHAARLPLHEGQAKAWFAEPAARALTLAYDQEIVLHAFFDALARGEVTMPQPERPIGIDAIAEMFERAKAENRAAFLPYFPIGYPNYAESVEAIAQMAAAGVDGFEIGIPFSDPLADGPVIQAATQIALENGTTVRACLGAVQELRGRGIDQPMLLMGYMNPLIAYGLEAFVRDAKTAGADGLIVPDLPVEEGAALAAICRREGLALVFFLAPTSSAERVALVAQQASGFIYVVALTGITGERTQLPPDLADFIGRVKASAGTTPLVLGFGISQPDHVRMVSELVDGFIVGSALVRAGKDGAAAVRGLADSLRRALD